MQFWLMFSGFVWVFFLHLQVCWMDVSHRNTNSSYILQGHRRSVLKHWVVFFFHSPCFIFKGLLIKLWQTHFKCFSTEKDACATETLWAKLACAEGFWRCAVGAVSLVMMGRTGMKSGFAEFTEWSTYSTVLSSLWALPALTNIIEQPDGIERTKPMNVPVFWCCSLPGKGMAAASLLLHTVG